MIYAFMPGFSQITSMCVFFKNNAFGILLTVSVK